MDPAAGRLECLKLAQQSAATDGENRGAAKILAVAQKWAEFVNGPSLRESLNSGAPKGADEK